MGYLSKGVRAGEGVREGGGRGGGREEGGRGGREGNEKMDRKTSEMFGKLQLSCMVYFIQEILAKCTLLL